VHRLDKDTSGVILVAKTAAAAAWITAGFYNQSTKKVYWAVVKGIPTAPQGKIDIPLAKKMGVFGETVDFNEETGRQAITFYKTKETFKKEAAWLELNPLTGRMHQLRVHCSLMDTPILGDKKYGISKASYSLNSFPELNFNKLHLHARSITLLTPKGSSLMITAPLAPYLKQTWETLGFNTTEVS
jgi:23S rRNA pseudouridine955/2504/2580 synthase